MTEYETYQEHIRHAHNAYCRIVIRHASFDAARMLAARWKREISLEYLTEEKFVLLSTTDEYFQAPDYDRKFRNFWGSTKAVRQLSDTICIENGLSIVENPKPHGKSYNKWLGDQAKPSHRELLRVAIDNALSQSPANFEELLRLLQESGCEVSKRGKSYRLKLPGWEKAARMDSLGEGYGLDDLQAVLSGKKAHTPRKKIGESFLFL